MQTTNRELNWKKGQADKVKLMLICTGIFVLNFVLKLLFLDSRDIALDEPFTLFQAQKSFSGIFEMLKEENNPPLYFLFMKVWTALFGIGAFAARLPSCIFSSAAAVLIFLTGHRFLNIRTGLIACLFFSFSSMHMYYAHDARVYSLFFLLAVSSVYYFLDLFIDSRSNKSLVFLTLINFLLLYSHFFGIVFVLTEFACVFIVPQLRRTILKKILISNSFLLLAFLPYLPVLFHRYSSSSVNPQWIPAPLLSDLYTMLWRFSNAPVLTVVMAILLLVFVILSFRKNGSESGTNKTITRTLILFFFIPYIGIFLFSFHTPLFLDRYIIFTSFFYYMMVASSVEHLTQKNKVGFAMMFILPLSMAFTLNLNPDKKRNVKELVEKIRPMLKEESLVYIYPDYFDLNFTYYYNSDWFKQPEKLHSLLSSQHIFPIMQTEHVDSTLLQQYNDIYLIGASGEASSSCNGIHERLQHFLSEKEISVFYEHLYLVHFTRKK